eukprot:10358026-Prorocentrum_lima.AAC.1
MKHIVHRALTTAPLPLWAEGSNAPPGGETHRVKDAAHGWESQLLPARLHPDTFAVQEFCGG